MATVHLSGFNPSHSVIEADLAALLADNNIDVNQPPESTPGCQSDPDDQDCIPVFRNLGLNFADGSPSPATQKFFRIAAEEAEQEHVEIKVASSTDGGGALVAHPDFDSAQPIRLPFDECFGGTGPECEGGTRLFSGANPGIEPLDAAEPDESLYTLAGGTPVTLEVTRLDTGLTFHFGDARLDHVGAMVLLGQAPDFHADLEAQLVLSGGGAPSGTYSAGFKLTTTSSQYQSSDSFTVKFTPVDE